MRRALAAVAFLTRIPIRTAFTTEDVGRAAVFFPLVGAGMGLLQFGVWTLAGAHLSGLLTATLVVTFSAWMTRGLHLDGLADFVDGLGGGRTRDDVLRIMKDSRIGAFGAIALVVGLVLKIAAIEALKSPEALIVAPALSRFSAVALSFALPYVRPGVAAPAGHVGVFELAGATLLSAGLVAFLGHMELAVAVVAVSVIVGLIAKRRIGGVTGDVLGANIEMAETAALVIATL